MHPFRRPWLWLGLWLAAVLAVIALSLVAAPKLPEVPTGGDKVEHFLAYFLLAAGAVQLFRIPRYWLWCTAGLVAMGIGLEFAQGAFTVDRMADPMDALANTLGALGGLAIALTPLRDLLLRWETRAARR